MQRSLTLWLLVIFVLTFRWSKALSASLMVSYRSPNLATSSRGDRASWKSKKKHSIIQCITFKIFTPYICQYIYVKLTVGHLILINKSTHEQKYSHKWWEKEYGYKRSFPIANWYNCTDLEWLYTVNRSTWKFLKSCETCHLPMTHSCKCVYFKRNVPFYNW